MHRVDLARAKQLLDRIRETRILVVGDLMLDVYLSGATSRISPEAPVPVVRVNQEWRALGGAGNVAANLVRLGAATAVVGAVGEDASGRDFHRVAEEAGIDTRGLLALDRPTTVKTRILVGHHQIARYDRELDTDVPAEEADRLAGAVEERAQDVDAIVLEDYDKGVLVPAVIEAALDSARRHGIPVIVDPKARHFFRYRGCTVFKPNEPELAAALRTPLRPDDPEWMEETRTHMECDALLLTLGSAGMALSTGPGSLLRVPAVARSVYDVSGAGDTVTALMAATLAAGGAADEGAVLATHAAGVEVGKAGVVTVTPEEILDSVDRHPDDT
jgi:D-beta-D-heptose 7-phosphate kinase/D-beta-D-heptose 1-phosphate adenosyltransferase